jgi:lysophospholipase L1-like esterase
MPLWIGVVLVVTLALTGCDRGPRTSLPEPPPGAPLAYVALGDSYPAGGGPVGGESYVDHYEDLIEQRTDTEVEVTDLAVSGATTADLLTTISGPDERAALQEAQLVTITIGGNDFLQTAGACRTEMACFDETLDEIEDRLIEVAGRVRVEAPGALILMTNYPDVVAGNPAALSFLGYGSFEIAREISMRSSELVCSVAEDHDMTCVDVYRAFNGADGEASAWEEGLLATDIIHPSPEGHRLIARLLCDLAC